MTMDQVEHIEDPQDERPVTPLGEDGATAGDGEAAALPEEPLDELSARVAEIATLQDKLKRAEAGFVNEAKRIRRKAEDDRKYAIEKVVVDLLPVIDALDGARAALGEDEASQAMREGLALVEKQLQSVFERYGIAAIEALGQPFDPARHQAMMMIEHPELAPQTVARVMRLGYELNGRVVRPAEVIVVKAPPADAPRPEKANEKANEKGAEEGEA